MTARFPDSRAANRPQWTPERRNHLESYFFKVNDPASDRAAWLKFTIYAPIDSAAPIVGEVWCVMFDPPGGGIWAGKEEYPIGTCRVDDAMPRVEMSQSWLEDGVTEGVIADDTGGQLRWALRFDAPSTPLVPFPWDWMYQAGIPKTKTVTPHPDVRATGFVEYGGKRWDFADLPAMQGHNWGREHAFRYAWVHCNTFEGAPDAVFEGFSARIRVAGMVTPPISAGMLRLDGEWMAFNRARALFRSDSEITHPRWRFELRQDGWVLAGVAETVPERMAGLTYRNPDGSPMACLNSKIATLNLELRAPDGSVRAQLHSRGAALETLTSEHDHPVRMRV